MNVVLASQSPRRRELLALLGLPFTVAVSTKPEEAQKGLAPAALAETLAEHKARDVAERFPNACVIGADTIVVLADGTVLGKPRDEADAARMLALLQGRTHRVYTGLALYTGGRAITAHESTAVTFAPMDADEIRWYVSTGEPMDKAGAYGIQGVGSRFIKGIEGDYFTVMGLPVRLLYEKLKELNLL